MVRLVNRIQCVRENEIILNNKDNKIMIINDDMHYIAQIRKQSEEKTTRKIVGLREATLL